MPTGPRVDDEDGIIISGFSGLSPAEFIGTRKPLSGSLQVRMIQWTNYFVLWRCFESFAVRKAKASEAA